MTISIERAVVEIFNGGGLLSSVATTSDVNVSVAANASAKMTIHVSTGGPFAKKNFIIKMSKETGSAWTCIVQKWGELTEPEIRFSFSALSTLTEIAGIAISKHFQSVEKKTEELILVEVEDPA